MRIALGQINTTVGDIRGNLMKALDVVGAATALDAGITLLPELALTGYPPEDLLAKDHFVEDNLDALEQLAGACGSAVIVGFVNRVDDQLFNAAALLGNHRVLRIYHKRNLPNYGVFDERRYFTPGEGVDLMELGGNLMSTTICEDIWVPGPAEEAAAEGAQLLFNVSASPFHTGKGAEREAMLAERARSNKMWLAYCNLVGGQDELVFDGRSCIISPEGTVIARGAAFEEDLVVADVTLGARLGAPASDIKPMLEGPEEVYRALSLGLHDYVTKNGFSDVVLGLSGGVDSALTATLAADALGAEHVHGVMMPSRFSSEGSVADSELLADALGIDARTIGIEGPHQAFLDSLAPSFEGREPDVAEENVQARVRGTLLMGLSNKFNWLTLATGNKSELSVGYSTLYGDMVGGFAPIKDVFKTRVYELCEWRNRQGEVPVIPEAILTKAPSAELRPDQVDQDSLPPYPVLDAILTHYVEKDDSRDAIVAMGFPAAIVDKVLRLTDIAEYKRRQGPLGVKITAKAFGRDRRMPVTNLYRG
ncbi:MAG TPA: NAD+ synthase [Coriobacteriia bacterium]|nr:NAD+ synthase [Coriobacteriia bacterium]